MKKEHKMTRLQNSSKWLLALSVIMLTAVFVVEAFAQNSAVVRSGAGSSALTVQQLQQQVQDLRDRNTNQQATIDANEAELQSIEDDTAVQQQRIDDENTRLTAAQPTGSDLDDRANAAEVEAALIKDHAKAALPTSPACPAGQKLRWNTSTTAWQCLAESDLTLGIHGESTRVPPACALDEKTIYNTATNTWSCAAELTVTGPAGPAGPDGAPGADGIDGGGIWQYGSGGEIYYSAGSIAAGGAPSASWKLRVYGEARADQADIGGALRPGSGTCAAGTEGGMRYNSGQDVVEVCVNGSWLAISVDGAGLCTPPGSCQSPWATWISDGSSVTAYQSATVPFGSTCNSQTRTCSSGTLSGSYNFQSCSVNPPASCSLPWGGSIGHGANVTAYQSSSVSCSSSCNGQTRTCNNGTLSGTYTNQSCTVNACSGCSLPWGGSIANGASVTAYVSASPSCGTSCSSQTRTCSDGSLSGSYTNQSCSTRCCLPWGGSIASGSSTTAYQASSVACGNSCVSQTRSCSGTTLSGSYTNASCSVAGCSSCTRPWGGTIAHGSSITAYQSSSVPCGNSCNSQTRTCTNGSLSGTYTNQSCSVGACGCSLPWGGSIANGASVTAYQTSSVSCGNSCNSQTRTCSGGTLSGTYTNQSCSVGSCSNCTLDGVTINHGSTATFYQSTRGCSQACTAIDGTRGCNNGSLTGTTSYNKAACPAATCASCTNPGGGTTAHGSCVTRYSTGSSQQTCGACIMCPQTTWCCNDGTGSGTWGSYSFCNNSCTCNPTCSFDCF